MKNYSEYVTESTNSIATLKKACKKNGYTISSIFKQLYPSDTALSYKSSGGFRGEKILSDITSKLKEAGWKKYDSKNSARPDGSSFTYDDAYVSPDETVVFLYYKNYEWGSNFFKGSFILTSDLEEETTKNQTLEEMKPLLKELGINYPGTSDFVDSFTYQNKSATAMGMDKKLNEKGWKQTSDTTWEKGGFIATFTKDEKPWGEFTMTPKNPKPVKLKF